MKKISTREKILTAARALFAEHGFAGTSMCNIAKTANVNHSLLFHHFGNKENLWQQVKQDIVEQANEAQKTLPNTELPFADFLEKLVRNSIHFYKKNPDIVRMINWQRLETTRESPLVYSSEAKAWMAAIKHYQQQGDIDKSLKSEFVMAMILSITSVAALDLKAIIASERGQQTYIKFCVERLIVAFSVAE